MTGERERVVRVQLASGEHFYVKAEVIAVEGRLYNNGNGDHGLADRLVYLGSRLVNPALVEQLTVEYAELVSSNHSPEVLED